MSFLQAKKQKRPITAVEMQDALITGEEKINRICAIAEGRIRDFDRISTYLTQTLALIDQRKQVNLDEIPKIIKESSEDVEAIKNIIHELTTLQLTTKADNTLRQQKVQKLGVNFKEMKQKLQDYINQFQRKQQQSIEFAQSHQQSYQNHLDGRDSNHQLLEVADDQFQAYDEHFIERRQQQITQISRVMHQLKDMMVDAATEVDRQHEGLQMISNHIKSAKNTVKDAHKEVVQAVKFEQASNKRNLMLCIIITLIIFVIILMINAGRKDKTVYVEILPDEGLSPEPTLPE